MHRFPVRLAAEAGRGITTAMDDRQRPTRTAHLPPPKTPFDGGQCSGSGPTRQSGAVDVEALIRSLQRAEGQAPCFRTGLTACERSDCPWRGYCFDSPGDTSNAGPEEPA